MRSKIISEIFALAREESAFEKLENSISELTKISLKKNIIECGILPEMFDHDSSEEKLWAKYSDIVLSLALNYLDINSRVLGARGNSADVLGETDAYTLVADAKTFRLSRTAKNQKDFKVSALDSWRENNNYAFLVSPLVQYPTKKSQIYKQAIEQNVTLISYTHLYFLLEYYKKCDLSYIWNTGNRLKEKLSDGQKSDANEYWNQIDSAVCKVLKKQKKDLIEIKELEISKTEEIGKEGIQYWEDQIQKFSKLSKKEAVNLLVKSHKIESKIFTIQKMIKKKVIYE